MRPTSAPCEWGNGTQLDALLESLENLATQSFDWLVILSGQDYPVRPVAELAAFLADTEHQLFLAIEDAFASPPRRDAR